MHIPFEVRVTVVLDVVTVAVLPFDEAERVRDDDQLLSGYLGKKVSNPAAVRDECPPHVSDGGLLRC